MIFAAHSTGTRRHQRLNGRRSDPLSAAVDIAFWYRSGQFSSFIRYPQSFRCNPHIRITGYLRAGFDDDDVPRLRCCWLATAHAITRSSTSWLQHRAAVLALKASYSSEAHKAASVCAGTANWQSPLLTETSPTGLRANVEAIPRIADFVINFHRTLAITYTGSRISLRTLLHFILMRVARGEVLRFKWGAAISAYQRFHVLHTCSMPASSISSRLDARFCNRKIFHARRAYFHFADRPPYIFTPAFCAADIIRRLPTDTTL